MFYDRLNPTQRGIVTMIFGVVLLLYTLGIFAALFYYVLILVALGLIGCGFVESGLYDVLKAKIKKSK